MSARRWGQIAQYCVMGTILSFPEDWVPPNVSLALARLKLMGERRLDTNL
jgi:hypothetical protein